MAKLIGGWGVKTKVTSFKLTKYDLATAYLDTLVFCFVHGDAT